MEYKVEMLPANVVGSRGAAAGAAGYIQQRLNEWARVGWELDQIAQIAVTESPGCLASLFGAKSVTIEFNCLVFRKPSVANQVPPPPPSKPVS